MNLLEGIYMALIELWQNKIRSLLTLLGIVFGIASIFSIFSISEGAKKEAEHQLSFLGKSVIQIIKVKAKDPAYRAYKFYLNYSDSLFLKDLLKQIKYIAVENKIKKRQLYYNSKFRDYNLVAVNENIFKAYHFKLLKGRFINYFDVKNYKKVCVITDKVYKSLFLSTNPIGKTLAIDKQVFTIIGVLKYNDTSSITAIKLRNINKDIYIPITTTYRYLIGRLKNMLVDKMIIVFYDKYLYKIDSLTKIIKKALKNRHYNMQNFDILVPKDIIKKKQEIQNIFNLVLSFIATISLIIGGISITNIMLVIIYQRIREIGIRRAVGASRLDILFQFILESVVITLLGGIFGIFLGMFFSLIIADYTKWQIVFSFKIAFLSLGVSIILGIIFGFYPAYLASKLNIAQALRFE